MAVLYWLVYWCKSLLFSAFAKTFGREDQAAALSLLEQLYYLDASSAYFFDPLPYPQQQLRAAVCNMRSEYAAFRRMTRARRSSTADRDFSHAQTRKPRIKRRGKRVA